MSAKSTAFALVLIALAGTPLHAQAQADNRTILLLVRDVPGAPTPEEIISYINTWPHATPPLQAFSVKDPVVGNYLLPDRASGDFLTWQQANPNSVRKKLEDYMLPVFASPADIPEALAALQADPFVEVAEIAPEMQFHAGFSVNGRLHLQPLGGTQYGWDEMNLGAAWQITGGGYAQIAQIDAGLYVNGQSFRQFVGSSYVGGNHIPAASKDVGLTGQPLQPGFDPSDVDEAKAMFIPASPCTPVDATLAPEHLGHGTHVAGLLGANGDSGQGVKGSCKHCGIAMYRTAFLECYKDLSPPQVLPTFNNNAADRAKIEAIDAGSAALSMSFGFPNSPFYDCGPNRNQANCLAIAYSVSRDAAMIASSGNDRTELNFPASDRRVISVGGFQSDGQGSLAFWDESPGGAIDCPLYPLGLECGSDFSKWYGGALGYRTHQELLGSAQNVLSTTYPNTNYRDDLACGDGHGTPMGDGIGWCTGTSMSAPQIAGVVGLLRSINPLAPIGEPEPAPGTPTGLRTVLARSATQAQAGQPWNPYLGYGIPDAAASARKVLGMVAGVTIRNRATPLFRLYSAYWKDFAETTSPQYALSLMITQVHNYVQPSVGLGAQPPVPGYAFPYDAYDPNISGDSYESAPAVPRAAMYVLTTDVHPRSEWPALVPLHLMDKINATMHNYLLVTPGDIEGAHADGYDLRTIQGYIYQSCNPEPACIPPAAEPIYRACKAADADCAVFLESERSAFEAAGYLLAYPAGGNKKLGYAYSAADSDSDGLPDGLEYAIGTSATLMDSDGDGTKDASEFPLAGIAVSDPCAGGTGALHCPANIIFANGFDGL